MKALQIRLEYVGTGGTPLSDIPRNHVWRVWREPKVCGREWNSERKCNVRTSGPQWAFEDSDGYVRYIGETWAMALVRLRGYVESYGMRLLQELS